ncbi:hypothetical protein ACEQ8H_008488 [Pleosporales sp. CAS-2024a]
MKPNHQTVGLSALLAFAATRVSAQVSSICPLSNVCFKLNIPASTASSGTGDIFFQITAPSSYEWIALAQGTAMVGSNMFLVYTSANGNNVTLSPRQVTGYTQPIFTSAVQATLLEGSGVSNGVMTANVKCSNCASWTGGSMNFKAAKGDWVYAFNSANGPKNTDSQSASIRMHTAHDSFSWSFADAKGGSSVNPLVNPPANDAPGGSNTGSAPAATKLPSGAGNTNGANGANQVTPGFVSTGKARGSDRKAKIIAHGVLASLAFVILFPAGAIAIRLASFRGVVWLHGAFQVFAYAVYIAAAGLGIHIASDLRLLDNYHPIIGLVVLGALFFQPILGYMHHIMFKKHSQRTFWSHGHVWLGRILITLGIINGGLGLKLADNSPSGEIVYAVVAGLMWLVWVASAVIGERRRSVAMANMPEKLRNDSGASEVGTDAAPFAGGQYEMENKK